jgi:hypothetical protein
MSNTASDVRSARSYLQTAGIGTGQVSPRHFATAAKETGKGYRQTLKFLNLLLSGGSGDGPSKIATANADRHDPESALGDMTPSQKMEYDNVSGSK